MRLDILEEHASEAMFLFEHRQRALTSLVLDQSFLSDLDERLIAHLDGLVLARETGWEVAAALIESDEPSGAFVAGAVALMGAAPRALDAVETALVTLAPGPFGALVAALRLWPQAITAGSQRAAHWLDRPEARLRSAGIAALGAAGQPPAPAVIARALDDQAADPVWIGAALEAAGWSRDRQHLARVLGLIAHDDAGVRDAALQAALLLDGAQARDQARQRWLVEADRAVAARALGFVGEARDAGELAGALVDAAPSARRSIVLGLGNLGCAEGIGPLLDAARGGDVRARLAGFALRRVLGAAGEWRARPEPPDVDEPASGTDDRDAEPSRESWTPDHELPLWFVDPIAAAWQAVRGRLAGQRVRGGSAWVAGAPAPGSPLGAQFDDALEIALATPGARPRQVAALTARAPFAWRAAPEVPAASFAQGARGA